MMETIRFGHTRFNSRTLPALIGHQIKYRTLSWPIVAAIMCTEIVTGGTLTLPQALGVVGIVPGLIVLIFCGIFALYTAFL